MSQKAVCPKCGHQFDDDMEILEMKSGDGRKIVAYACPQCHSILSVVPG